MQDAARLGGGLPQAPPPAAQQRPGCNRAGIPAHTRHARARARASTLSRQEAAQAPVMPAEKEYRTLESTVGQTPLVRLQRLNPNPSNVVLCKLEGNNPAGSVKDRPALSMIAEAEAAGLISPGDTLIEATSGNTGIALAMAAAIKGYRMKLIMPANMTEERRAAMAAYGAQLISVPAGKMELARDMALEMQARGEGKVLDQFSNTDNPLAHYRGTGPELWEQTRGRITHFVSSMGTTGTIMGVSRFLKERSPGVRIVGLQPAAGSEIAGIRRWPAAYLPRIFDETRVDEVMEISQREANETMRALARTEGIFAGVSSGGAVSAALRLSARVSDATICVIVCDRGDRYLSSGGFSEAAAAGDPQPCPVEEWPSLLARRVAHPGPHFALFTADRDPGTGIPWCGDCARALAAARQRVRAAGGTLLEVEVGPRAVWKDPAHPLRHDSALRLAGIPTLVHWRADGPGRVLAGELERAGSEAAADSLIRDFVAACKEEGSSGSSSGGLQAARSNGRANGHSSRGNGKARMPDVRANAAA